MTPDAAAVDRRTFLKVGAAAGGGLMLWIALPRVAAAAVDEGAEAGGAPVRLGMFVAIGTNGIVTVAIPRPDMGQGVRTSLAMLVAEELDVDWASVRAVQADLDPGYGDQYSGGSSSVRGSWELLRRAGAAARLLIRRAAAEQFGVPEDDCDTLKGHVRHKASGRELPYGKLVKRASRLTLCAEVPPLKDPSTYGIVGHAVPQLDVPDITHGRIKFGIDVRVPKMLRAVIERAPEFGAKPLRVDDAAARRVGGVRDVVVIDADALPALEENSPEPANGVAVVAESTWAAMQGRRALAIQWSTGDAANESTDAMRERCVTLHGQPPHWVIRHDGDPERQLGRAAQRVEAEYEVPLLAHATMEPMNCLAHVRGNACEVWAPTQNPEGVRDAVARVLRIPPPNVTVHVMRMGGGFGRRFYADYAVEAAIVSQKVRAPVQVTWTREDDMRHGFSRPAGLHRLRAGLDANGRPIAWTHMLVNASRGHYLRWEPPPGKELQPGELDRDDFPSHFIDDLELAYTTVASPIPRGQWRAVEDSATVFVVQSFIDELAHASGKDPVQFRLDLLGAPRDIPYGGRTYESGRISGVLELVAAKSNWGAPLPKGMGRGVACGYANHAYVAEVAEVEVSEAGEVRIHRVVAAVDCGRVVNPVGAVAQVEGAIIYGASAALSGEITVEKGAVVQGSFDDYPVMRIDAAPTIEVHFMPSESQPLGLGEGALPTIAPAIANAIFAVTGVRVRKLPIKKVARG